MPNIIKTQSDERHWEKAKGIVKEQYPDVQENSKQFYKLVMGVFKKMTKTASSEETINILYSEGVITKEAVDLFYENKKVTEVEEVFKEAGIGGELVDSAKAKLPEGAMLGLGIAGATAGLAGGIKGFNALKNKLTRKKRVEEAAKFSPEIRDLDPHLLNAAMKDIERLNPDYAKSPLITGEYLKQIKTWGGLNIDQANLLKDKEHGKRTLDNFTQGFEMASKSGGPRKHASEFKTQLKDKTMTGLTNAAGAAVVTGGMVGGAMLAKKLLNKFTRGSRVKEMHELYPDLKKYDEKKVTRALESVEKINPTFAKDPYISGGYVRDILKNKGIKPKTVEGLAGAAGDLENYQPFSTAKNYLSS